MADKTVQGDPDLVRRRLIDDAKERLQADQQTRRTAPPAPAEGPVIVLTPLSSIPIRAAEWLWADRLPNGELALLAGREGVGKSTLDCWIAARVSTGTLEGELYGTPRSVLMVCTEDDYGTTIKPRLLAAGADLDRIFKVDVQHPGTDRSSQLHLPTDFGAFEKALAEKRPALVIFSPLMSRLSGKLDAHKDQEVRQGLEPLVEVAERFGCCILGLIHLNKAGGTDPLRAVMGSAAFVAVARAVMFVQRDPDDERIRVIGQPKNNLGKVNPELELLTFSIAVARVGTSADGKPISATQIAWGEGRSGTIDQLLVETNTPPETRTVVADCAEWLEEFLTTAGGVVSRETVLAAAKAAGYAETTLKRARAKLGVRVDRALTFPRATTWVLERAVTPLLVRRVGHGTEPAWPDGTSGPDEAAEAQELPSDQPLPGSPNGPDRPDETNEQPSGPSVPLVPSDPLGPSVHPDRKAGHPRRLTSTAKLPSEDD